MPYLPIQGYEQIYEVSDLGQVRSLDRHTTGKDGCIYPFRGVTLKPAVHKDTGYLMVSLWKGGVGRHHYVHRLVAEAHIPNPMGLPEVNHKDGIRTNATVGNLEWVTGQENKQHAVDSGLRVYTHRLTRDEFVECIHDIIGGESYQSLSERVPYKVPFLSTKLRQLAKELGLEQDLDNSLREQRITRARINGAKHSRAD